MATNVKKISELEKISSLSNSHNILIEENGRAKRIASSNIGKVKTVNGVEPDENGNIEIVIPEVEVPEIPEQIQSDFSQNDPTQPDYVKHRTHYEENNQTVIEWDGNTEGRDSFTFSDATFWKVSELIPQEDDLVGCSLGTTNGSMDNIEAGHTQVGEGCFLFYNVVMVVNDTSATIEGKSLEVPSTGIYFISIGGGYVTSLTYGSIVVHKLAPKFLPEGGVGWVECDLNTIEWDGVTEGRDCVSPTDGLTLCKVSDTLIEPEELVGRTIHLSDGRTYEITSDHIIIEDDMYCIIDFDTDDFAYLYAIQALEVDGAVFPSTGMYAMYLDGTPHFSKVEYGSKTIHQLDEKFIPGSIARKDDVNIFLITLTMGDNVEDDTGAHDYSCRADRTYDEVNAAFVAGKHIVLRYDSNVYNFSNYTNYENFTLAFVENGEFHFTYVAYGESPYQCIKSGEVVLDSQGNWTYTLIHKQILPTSDAEDEPQMLLGDKYGWFTNPLFCNEVPSVTEENNGAFLQVVNGVWTAVNLTDVSTEGA